MASATRFPKGLNTFAPRSALATFPVAPSPSEVIVTEDFIPYVAAKYTVTTAVAGTVTTFPWLTGMVKLATSASATDTIWMMLNGAGFQFLPLNQLWMNSRVVYPRTVNNANDTNFYTGLFDNAVPTSATNGVYFFKPTGGTAVHLVIKKAGTTTTIQNVADLAVPSGLYGDANSVNGTLSATIAGTAFTGVTVATPGSGYAQMPLVLSTSTAGGTAGSTPVTVTLGSTSLSQTNPQVPIQSTGLTYGSLYAPYVTTPGSGFTNQGPLATLLEVEPVIDLQLYYNGKDTLYAAVNGRVVASIGPGGVTNLAAGATVNNATAGPSYASASQLTTAIAPVQPTVGSAYNMLPQVLLNFVAGFANTTVNIRNMYLSDTYLGAEYN